MGMTLEELKLIEKIIDYGTTGIPAVSLVRASQIIKREIELKEMDPRK